MPQKTPFLKYTLAFAAGILIPNALPIELSLRTLAMIMLPQLFISVWEIRQSRPLLSDAGAITVILLLAMSGWFYSVAYHKTLFNDNVPLNGQFCGAIIEKNNPTGKNVRYIVKLKGVNHNDSIYPLHEKIILMVSDSTTNALLVPGTQISFITRLHPISMNNNPGEFNYKGHMFRKGIRHQGYVREKISIMPNQEHQIKTYALNLRAKLLEKYLEYGIINEEFAVLAALTLGEKSYLNSNLRKSFSASGAMHVLAVSGLHVGIIFMVLSLMLKQMGKSQKARIVRIVLIVISLWGYAFITGLSPSVMRASTMFTLITIGNNMQRASNIYNTLAVSAFFLMLLNPNIIFETGFQLSYAAVASIVFFQPRIAALWQVKNPVLKYLWELLAVSVAAQIGTFAISIYYFHQFPVYFWISNYIVIPAAALLLYGAMLLFVLGFVPTVANTLSYGLSLILKAMIGGVKWVESLPLSVVTNIWIDELTLFFLIVIVLASAWFIVKQRAQLLMGIICLSIVISAYSALKNIKIQNQSVIVFYNNYNDQLLSFIDGPNHYYFTTSDSISSNTQVLLDNCSGYFRANKAERIEKGDLVKSIVIYDNKILFKHLSINLLETNRPSHSKTDNINWIPKKSVIEIKHNNLIILKKFNNSKLKNIPNSLWPYTFDTRKNGALLVFI